MHEEAHHQGGRKHPNTAANRRRNQAGFVITLELLLISTVLILAVVVMLAALRNALVQNGIFLGPVLLYDSSAPDPRLIGKVSSWDNTQTPQILRRDPTSGAPIPLGVRRDRWTTRSPVFYAAENCTGTPYVAVPSSFALLDFDVGTGFDFFGEIQGMVYAAGVGGGIVAESPFGPGELLLSDPVAASSPMIASLYMSSWELLDHPGGPPPAIGPPWSSSEHSPCRDLPNAAKSGLVTASSVLDPVSLVNVLAPFLPPFQAR